MNKKTFLIIIIFSVIGCKFKTEPETPENLYNKYRGSVVLIKNKFYYEIELGNGFKIFLNELNNLDFDNLRFTEASAIAEAKTIYGTGFFITSNGIIATNRHVVNPIENEIEFLSNLKTKFDDLKFKLQEQQYRFSDSINQINIILQTNPYLDYSAINFLNEKKENFGEDRAIYTKLILNFDFEPSRASVKCINSYLGIALESSYVLKNSDFKECVFKLKSNDLEVDLALIQTKDKITPSTVKNLFDFKENNPNVSSRNEELNPNTKHLKIDTKVYMMGFNNGLELARTSDGIKAQFTQGTVSQESDEYRVLYSIPSLSGSSGSPVIDEWGNLVAINFAKVNNTQSFNYGIPAKHLKNLYDKIK